MKHFREHPEEYLNHCKEIEAEISQMFKMILRGSPESEEARKVCEAVVEQWYVS